MQTHYFGMMMDCIGDYESLSIYSKDDLVMVIKEINFDNNELKL